VETWPAISDANDFLCASDSAGLLAEQDPRLFIRIIFQATAASFFTDVQKAVRRRDESHRHSDLHLFLRLSSTLITLIGATNIFQTPSAPNVALRRREFAMLKNR